MKYFTFLFISIFLLGTVSTVFAQESDFQHIQGTIETAVDSLEPEKLVALNTKLEKLSESRDDLTRKYALYYLGYSNYRLNVAFSDFKEDQKEAYLDEAVEWLEKATEEDKSFAEAYALLASCYGKKASGIFSGMKYGPKSDAAMTKALELSPENPRVLMLDAIGKLYKPSMFGGSTEGAIEGFTKAADAFKNWQPPNIMAPTWGHAEAYAWLGQALAKQEKYKQAEQAYQKALDIQPGYPWVKKSLLPELEKSS